MLPRREDLSTGPGGPQPRRGTEEGGGRTEDRASTGVGMAVWPGEGLPSSEPMEAVPAPPRSRRTYSGVKGRGV